MLKILANFSRFYLDSIKNTIFTLLNLFSFFYKDQFPNECPNQIMVQALSYRMETEKHCYKLIEKSPILLRTVCGFIRLIRLWGCKML